MFYDNTPIRFECTACGKCCTGNSETHYIALNTQEAEKLRLHLGVSESWFRRRYVEHLTREGWAIRMRNGRCVFLGEDMQCSIYALRPTQCQTYPFWPELLDTREHWHAEKKYCEGINRGEPVKLRNIRKKLQQQIKAEEY